MATNLSNNATYSVLINTIGEVLEQGKRSVLQTVNHAIVQTYWAIGKHIVEFEQAGNEKAEYGSDMLNRLSNDLTARYGKGFSRANVFYIRKLYMSYPKVQTVSKLLSWSHFVELLKLDDPLERSFYRNRTKSLSFQAA
ncbi:MAG: hypothetical protein IKZ88_07400 [Neisseriaceae bacterium]|nr:hypothetical protein [Neisseriaceae bacterium]